MTQSPQHQADNCALTPADIAEKSFTENCNFSIAGGNFAVN